MLMMRWLSWLSGAGDALALVAFGGSGTSGKKRLGADADDALALVASGGCGKWLGHDDLVAFGGSGKKRLGPDAHDALALVASGGSGKKRLGPDAHDALALVDFWEETAGP